MNAATRLIDRVEQYRPLFLARTRREKVLFALFLAAIVIVWAGTLPGRMSETSRDVTLARQNIAEQDRWFENEARIEEDYQRALATLDPAKLPPRQQVIAELEAQARQGGLTPRIDPGRSEKVDRLTFHTINVSFDRVEFGRVATFQRSVAAAMPSVNLKTIVVNSAARNAGSSEISARLTYEAIEYTH